MIDREPLLTRAEVAKRLGVSPDTLRLWQREKRGPRVVRLGKLPHGRIRYRESDVARYISECHTPSLSAGSRRARPRRKKP